MSNKIEKVLQEAVTWENKPITELLGATAVIGLDSLKQIIMYGPTQVGKTTLILDLLGIKSDMRSELDKVLKGGAKSGSASTSSAIVYSKWDRDVFGLATQNIHNMVSSEPEELSKEDFFKKIQYINEQNRTSGGETTNLCDIYCYYIPDDYFDGTTPLQNLQIIDLPGFGERNEKMRKRADEIISFISQMVAGAIVVVKSENTQKLESDYKDFISKHHFNHLAIAISHALATNFDVKNINSNSDLSDESAATQIVEHYFELIKSDHYMSFSNVEPNNIIFPLEKKDYIEKNAKQLTGAFNVIRNNLTSKINAMCNQTSINYCIEKLEHKNQMLREKITDTQEILKKEIKNEASFSKELDEIEAKKKKVEQALKNNGDAFMCLQKNTDEILLWIDAVKQLSFTDYDAELLWDQVRDKSEEQKRSFVREKLRMDIYNKIDPEKSKKNPFFVKVEKSTDEAIENFDYQDFLRYRGLLGHSKKWREEAVFYINYFYKKIINIIKRLIQKENESAFSELEYTRSSLTIKYNKLDLVLQNLDQKIKSCQKKQETYLLCIKEMKDDIKNNLMRRENVKKIFIKHFYLKKQELEQRIEHEPCAEIKTALFLVLSSIYLNMKPYLEENENE